MTPNSPWLIVPFDKSCHDRTRFDSGAPELDRYLRDVASQDLKRNVARLFVAVPPDKTTVVGYYSLSATSYQKSHLPLPEAKKLPHYPVPTPIIGRLAVDRTQQGRGLGEYLLMDALERVYKASRILAVQAIVVDARDDQAAAFYRRYGFRPFPTQPLRLFLPLRTFERQR